MQLCYFNRYARGLERILEFMQAHQVVDFIPPVDRPLSAWIREAEVISAIHSGCEGAVLFLMIFLRALVLQREFMSIGF